MFAPACADFGTALRELLTELFAGLFAEADRAAETGRCARVGPAEAADIAIALVRGLEPTPNARDLLGPAADALTTGLLHTRADVAADVAAGADQATAGGPNSRTASATMASRLA